jgi:FkbM family methyltransferase
VFISYAQNGEDIVLWRVLQHIENGTYVDVGAADPTEFSVTKAFYDRGWSGVNVEPAPEFVEKLHQQRPRDTTVALCAGEDEGPITLHLVPGTGLSTLSDEHLGVIADEKFEIVDLQTEVKRLDNILDSAQLSDQEIHFLKIDVEGAEETVLRSIDLGRWRPWVIVVEATEPLSTAQTHAAWDGLLTSAGYEFHLFDGLNRFYCSKDHPELAAALSYPAGVFDQPYTVGAGQNELAERAEAVVLERDQLAQSYAKLQAEHENYLRGHQQLQTEYETVVASYSTLEHTYQQAIASYQDLEQKYFHVLKRYEQVNATAAECAQALTVAQQHAGASAQREVEAADLIARLRGDLEMAEARSAAFATSTSWKVTAPLRFVKRLTSRGN